MNLLHLFKGRLLSNYFERYYPLGATLLTAGLLYYIPQAWLTLAFCKSLASSYATIFSICFGFAFASVSTLLGLSDKPFIRGMRESGALAGLISYHWSCIRWCSLGTALGGSGRTTAFRVVSGLAGRSFYCCRYRCVFVYMADRSFLRQGH